MKDASEGIVEKMVSIKIESNRLISYYNNEGKLHREDGPAIEYPDGTKYWYKEGKLHREDGPAKECPDGTKYWYKEGKPHREDGPAEQDAGSYCTVENIIVGNEAPPNNKSKSENNENTSDFTILLASLLVAGIAGIYKGKHIEKKEASKKQKNIIVV